jgi:hypothetical protein
MRSGQVSAENEVTGKAEVEASDLNRMPNPPRT